jgi:hypothetical protein
MSVKLRDEVEAAADERDGRIGRDTGSRSSSSCALGEVRTAAVMSMSTSGEEDVRDGIPIF